MTHERLIDLDDPGHVELLWLELERRRAVRKINPELRDAIEVRCKGFAPEVAAPILAALDNAPRGRGGRLPRRVSAWQQNQPFGTLIRQRERPPLR